MVRWFGKLVVLAILASAAVLAEQARFVSGTLGVHVDVLVTKGNVYVAGLTAADFELRDNGVLQSVDVIDPSDVPVNAGARARHERLHRGTEARRSDRREPRAARRPQAGGPRVADPPSTTPSRRACR
jgi:hypothetical protein